MWVVKLGGSLDAAGRLGAWARALARVDVPVLVVPGGGAFADGVRAAQRRWELDECTAHAMAVLAMEQMAHLLCALEPAFTGTDDVGEPLVSGPNPGPVRVWYPRRELLGGGWPEAARIPASWDVTSDSLAAMVAARVQASGLVLVKSAPLSQGSATAASLQVSGVLDAAFDRFGAACGCPVWLLGGTCPEAIFDLIADRARNSDALRVRFAAAAPVGERLA
jgi:aspartokinase-like uncharacterized kinase